MFESINKLIKSTNSPKFRMMQPAQVCYIALNIIEEIMPETKNKIKIISYDHNILKIASNNSMVLYKIKMNEEKIKKRVQKKVKIKTFKISYSPLE